MGPRAGEVRTIGTEGRDARRGVFVEARIMSGVKGSARGGYGSCRVDVRVGGY